jgi:TrmH family RNA methyltransferase
MRARHGEFIAEGARLVHEAIDSEWEIHQIVFREGTTNDELEEVARTHGINLVTSPADEFNELSDTVHSQGVLAIVARKPADAPGVMEKFRLAPEGAIVALDAVSDPGNVGTIIRTAEWFGCLGVICGKGTVEPFNPKVVRASMGSIFRLPIIEDNPLQVSLQALADSGYSIYCSAPRGEAISATYQFDSKSVIVIGSEARGVDPKIASIAHHRITLSGAGRAESLNAAVAAGILIAKATGRC